jgi:hypothetical protein
MDTGTSDGDDSEETNRVSNYDTGSDENEGVTQAAPTSRAVQDGTVEAEKLEALAFRIQDVGADGGIIVTTLDLQSGARKIADSQNIITVRMPQDSTVENYMMRTGHGARLVPVSSSGLPLRASGRNAAGQAEPHPAVPALHRTSLPDRRAALRGGLVMGTAAGHPERASDEAKMV